MRPSFTLSFLTYSEPPCVNESRNIRATLDGVGLELRQLIRQAVTEDFCWANDWHLDGIPAPRAEHIIVVEDGPSVWTMGLPRAVFEGPTFTLVGTDAGADGTVTVTWSEANVSILSGVALLLRYDPVSGTETHSAIDQLSIDNPSRRVTFQKSSGGAPGPLYLETLARWSPELCDGGGRQPRCSGEALSRRRVDSP